MSHYLILYTGYTVPHDKMMSLMKEYITFAQTYLCVDLTTPKAAMDGKTFSIFIVSRRFYTYIILIEGMERLHKLDCLRCTNDSQLFGYKRSQTLLRTPNGTAGKTLWSRQKLER